MHTADMFFWSRLLGYILVALISVIGVRLLLYYKSFFFHWARYRQLEQVTTADIRALPSIPFIKIQVTTRGQAGSTDVIRRGIRNVVELCREAPDLYLPKLSIEVVTESEEQVDLLERDFGDGVPLRGVVLPMPESYETPQGTKFKARGMHYIVELRRRGFNRKPGQTFIIHYDEESVMTPDELRKLIRYLATTDKKLTEGPILYPLEYMTTTTLCRAMEANRPIGCYECREVMETGTPLHLHGSNLVIDEELENELGWDIGTLDGQPFIAEDYVFGVLAYLKYGPQIFGWHGCIMLEQPPFSVKSAFRQRSRWIVGVLQGIAMMQRLPEFLQLSRRQRTRLIWGTRYRVLTFALGFPTGGVSLLYLLYQAILVLSGTSVPSLPLPISIWLIGIGFLWLNSMVIGVWFNTMNVPGLSQLQRWGEGMRVIAAAPFAGILESMAGFWGVARWLTGHRTVAWQPTPKTKAADRNMQ